MFRALEDLNHGNEIYMLTNSVVLTFDRLNQSTSLPHHKDLRYLRSTANKKHSCTENLSVDDKEILDKRSKPEIKEP